MKIGEKYKIEKNYGPDFEVIASYTRKSGEVGYVLEDPSTGGGVVFSWYNKWVKVKEKPKAGEVWVNKNTDQECDIGGIGRCFGEEIVVCKYHGLHVFKLDFFLDNFYKKEIT